MDADQKRKPERRAEVLDELGGSRATAEAVDRALQWLASRQQPDGRWHGKRFGPDGGPRDAPARARVDTAVTGLSLLCFLAAYHTHDDDGPYRRVVATGLDRLVGEQGDDGSLMARESMCSHGIATIALAEAYGMTNDPALRDPLQRAVDFIYDARDRPAGG